MCAQHSTERSIPNGAGIIDAPTARFDESRTDVPHFARRQRDRGVAKAASFINPRASVTIDAEIAERIGEQQRQRTKVGAPVLHAPIVVASLTSLQRSRFSVDNP